MLYSVNARKNNNNCRGRKNYRALHLGIQVVIAVGFKVNSERVAQFRLWVNPGEYSERSIICVYIGNECTCKIAC